MKKDARQTAAGAVRYSHPRRQWWQRIVRAAAIVAAVLIGAYATIPWWAPTDLLRRRIAGAMSEQMDVAVEIDDLSLSWSEGVEIVGLRIGSPEGFDGPMLDVERIRCDLSPFDFFVRGRIEWMELHRPRLCVRFDERGSCNLSALGCLKIEVLAGRMSVRRAVVEAHLPARDDPLLLNVNDLQFTVGRDGAFGRLTISAALEQKGGSATVAAHASAETGLKDVAATGALNFTNLDLEQLRLAELLHLPLGKLGGRCSGSLDLMVNDQGVVDRFGLNVSVRRLDAQPRSGPSLPVIEEAGLTVAAVIDPLAPGGGKVELQSLKIRLPGIDLAGRANVAMDIPRGWEFVDTVDLRGKVHPSRLAALMTGEADLPGGVRMDGPLDVRVKLSRRGAGLSVALGMKGGEAIVRRDGRIVKPAGRAMEFRLDGTFERRIWTFRAEKSELFLGANRFTGRGTLRNLRGFVDRWRDVPGGEAIRTAGRELQNLEWRGNWEVRDLPALGDLWPVFADALKHVELHGPVTGHYVLDHAAGSQVRADVEVPAETRLKVGGTFVKPENTPIFATIAGKIDPDGEHISDLDVDLAVGRGRINLTGGLVRLENVAEGKLRDVKVHATGRLELRNVESLLASLPKWSAPDRTLSGSVAGEYSFDLDADLMQADVEELDLTDVDIAWGKAYVKPAGEPLKLHAMFGRENSGTSPAQGLLICGVCPHGEIKGGVVWFPKGPAGEAQNDQVMFNASILDARWLAESSPWIRDLLAGGRLEGPLRVLLDGIHHDGVWDGMLICDAEKMFYESAGSVRRIKRPGVPLRLHVTGRVEPGEKTVSATIESAALKLGKSKLTYKGSATVIPPVFRPDKIAGCRVAPSSGAERSGAKLVGALRPCPYTIHNFRFAPVEGYVFSLVEAIDSSHGRKPVVESPPSSRAPAGRLTRLPAGGGQGRSIVPTGLFGTVRPFPRANLAPLGCALGYYQTPHPGLNKYVEGGAPHSRSDRELIGLKSFNVEFRAKIVLDGAVGDLFPEWSAQVDRHGLTGRAHLAGTLAGDVDGITVRSHLDAKDISAEHVVLAAGGPSDGEGINAGLGLLVKPDGMPAHADISATLPADISAVNLRDLTVRVGDLSIVAAGRIALNPDRTGLGALAEVRNGQVAVSTNQAEGLAQLIPVLDPYRLTGSALAELTFRGEEVPVARLHLDRLSGHVRGKDVLLDGSVAVRDALVDYEALKKALRPPPPVAANGLADLEPIGIGSIVRRIGRVSTDGLEFRIGANHGWAVADVSDIPAGPRGSFHLVCEHLNDADLADWFAPPSSPADRTGSLSPQAAEQLKNRAEKLIVQARDKLAQAVLSGRVSVDRLRTFDASVGESYKLRQFALSTSLQRGHLKLRFAAGLNGGPYRTRVDTQLTDEQPTLASVTEMCDVVASKSIQPQLAKFFPGNTVLGLFNRRQDVEAPLADALANLLNGRYVVRPVGTGKTVTIDGEVRGRGAPKFVTAIFPGLNLTKYRYRKMTAFAEYRSDGTAVNDMIFDGQLYDLYMEGTTDAHNIARYDVGLILLGAPQSADFNHRFRTGRMPLLKFKARIEGGKMHDEEVSYPWPNETFGVIFIKNNIFYRLWLDAQKHKNQ